MNYQMNMPLTVTWTEEQRRVCECGPSKCDAEVEVDRIKRTYKDRVTFCKARKEGKRGYIVRYGILVTRTDRIWGLAGFGFEPGAGFVKTYRDRKKTPKAAVEPAFIAEQFNMAI